MIEKVTDTIDQIGVNDHDITLFENQYMVDNGMAYNSYLIHDDKNVVLDTTDKDTEPQWLENLQNALGDEKVDYLVISHMEPDHSSSIRTLAELYPDMKLVGNAKTFQLLSQFFDVKDLDARKVVVKEGDTLPLGKHELVFYMAPMVHWPEVMVTYDKKDKVLFSADGFGKFGTRDADEDWDDEAARYYFNICGKYGNPVQGLLKKAAKLDIETIASLHGPVLKEDLGHYISLYDTWSSYKPDKDGVFIAVASAHGNTRRAADDFAAILEAKGVKVKLLDLVHKDKAEAVACAFRYPLTVCMANSYDAGVFPPMEYFLLTLQHKALNGRKFALIENGSWAPSAAKTMKSLIEPLKNCEIIEPVITIKSSLKEDNIKQMEELADNIVKALAE